jgi:hypothetical protein
MHYKLAGGTHLILLANCRKKVILPGACPPCKLQVALSQPMAPGKIILIKNDLQMNLFEVFVYSVLCLDVHV